MYLLDAVDACATGKTENAKKKTLDALRFPTNFYY
jgi:hypothetical protein